MLFIMAGRFVYCTLYKIPLTPYIVICNSYISKRIVSHLNCNIDQILFRRCNDCM